MSNKQLSLIRRDKIGFIFQEYNLLDTLTLEENMALPLTIQGLGPEKISLRVRKIADKLQIGDVLGKFPFQTSGGQKQRTCIASALASEREVIVYDEPTSGLDLHRMRQVARLIHDVRRRGAAQLVITHDPEFIMACCSWVVRLEDGGIMESYPLDAAGTRRLSGFFMHEGALDEKP